MELINKIIINNGHIALKTQTKTNPFTLFSGLITMNRITRTCTQRLKHCVFIVLIFRFFLFVGNRRQIINLSTVELRAFHILKRIFLTDNMKRKKNNTQRHTCMCSSRLVRVSIMRELFKEISFVSDC